MTDNNDKVTLLLEKLDLLLKRQDEFSSEINNLRKELNLLKGSQIDQTLEIRAAETEMSLINTSWDVKKDSTPAATQVPKPKAASIPSKTIFPPISQLPKAKSDLEKFIGENLINKIGIIITVIGVAIGAKYAIDHELVSPLTRIILGYLMGLGLLGFAINLKPKYEDFSAVLLSGSMAIMYFITYAAYSFYDLIPQIATFGIMVLFTAFTVVAALHYNRQVIAHIGLVGAYAVPFLLSDGSGKVGILFSYMAIINVGILVIAFKKYWKPLYYVSFGLTWLIFYAWFLSKYQNDQHFTLALTFLSVFFTIFYITFTAYKLVKTEKFEIDDVLLLLANSFIFYGIGYIILEGHKTGEQLLGAFTLGNAVVHFIVSTIIYRQKLADRSLFYLVSGLVLVFITIAIPVQLDGNWVTLLWAGEAALLFWIGRTKNVPVYEKLSYPLMLLAFFSIVHDWSSVYDNYNYDGSTKRLTPLLNINFLSSVLFIGAFSFINLINLKKEYTSALTSQKGIAKILSISIPAILLITLYFAFRMEISNYWEQRYADSELTITQENQDYPDYLRNYDLLKFKTLWIIHYSLIFTSLLALANIKKLKNKQFGQLNLILLTVALFIFLVVGLWELSLLRESYIQQNNSKYYQRGIYHISIRYISMGFVAIAILVWYQIAKQGFMEKKYKRLFYFLLHGTVLWILSSELIHWMDLANSTQSYKLGLSILWGAYSLFVITLGIWKKNKPLRIGAIVLFGVTLIKLFFYDLGHLDTIAKTIVLVSLGILLLIISFLYNKYKHKITDEDSR
jgi:uncharacterized membrane protein